MRTHWWITLALAHCVICVELTGCRKPHEAPRAPAPPPDAGDLKCLLETEHGRMHVQFGYRGDFGGSDNDLHLDVGASTSLSGHLWTGLSTSQATDGVVSTRAQGQADLRLLVGALLKPEQTSDVRTTTKAFVRVSYWCGAQRFGPFMIETHMPSEEEERALANMIGRGPTRPPPHHSYSRVHGTIAVARDILASVPSKSVDSPCQLQSARERLRSLYENGVRVRHDPVERWQDP
jgi:hypothetical protein